jgi:hypothetical protein
MEFEVEEATVWIEASGETWKKKLDEMMGWLGIVKSEADECLYILCKDGQVTLLVLVYVDDTVLASW